jgi:TolB-like protein/Tfp pilus assembly protein PilF
MMESAPDRAGELSQGVGRHVDRHPGVLRPDPCHTNTLQVHPLLRRLKDRKLVQWSLAYLAGAWLLVQLSHLLGQQFAWPDAVARGITVVLAVGFLGAVVVAWYHGDRGAQRATAVELLMLAGILVIAAAAVALVSTAQERDAAGIASGRAAAGPGAGDLAGALAVEDGSIAVLPFENLSGDPEQEYFSAGITDDILATLSRLAELKVISRTSSMQYRGTDKPVRRIGQELGVAHLVEGSVRRQGERVRITAQLIDARTDRQLWAETYDRELRDVFEIQTDVARRIADALRVALLVGAADGPARPQTGNLAAYDLFLRSRDLAGGGRDGNMAAIALLREAVRLDPDFAGAHAALSAALGRRMDFYSFPPDSAAAGIAAARRALELDDRLASGYRALAENLWYTGDFAEAAATARTAIALDPNDAASMELLFWAEYYLNNREEALRWALRGYRLNPRLASLPNALMVVFLDVGDYAQAERWAGRALELDPEDVWPQFNMVRLELALRRYDAAGRRAEALRRRDPTGVPGLLAAGDVSAHTGQWIRAAEHYRQAYALAPESDHYEPTRILLAHALARTGDDAGAAALLREARRDVEAMRAAQPDHRGWRWRLGAIHAIEGDHEGTIRWLEASYERGWSNAEQARHSPLFQGLRREPAFQELVRRLDARQAELRRRLDAVARQTWD